jgi:hypothetical protein
LTGITGYPVLKISQKQSLFIVANVAVGASVITSTALLGSNFFVDVAAFAVHSTIEAGRRMYIADKYGCSRDLNVLRANSD